MTEITKSITFLNEYKQLKKALEEGKTPVLAVGLAAIHKANLAAALGADLKRPVLVLTDDDNAANRFAADLRGFSEREVVVLPSRELVMADVAGVSRGYERTSCFARGAPRRGFRGRVRAGGGAAHHAARAAALVCRYADGGGERTAR